MVTAFEDVKLRVVKTSPDLKVMFVERTPYRCGEWMLVESGEDFKVRFVTAGEHATVKITETLVGGG